VNHVELPILHASLKELHVLHLKNLGSNLVDQGSTILITIFQFQLNGFVFQLLSDLMTSKIRFGCFKVPTFHYHAGPAILVLCSYVFDLMIRFPNHIYHLSLIYLCRVVHVSLSSHFLMFLHFFINQKSNPLTIKYNFPTRQLDLGILLIFLRAR